MSLTPEMTPRHANLAKLIRQAGDRRIEEVLDACGGNVELAVDYMMADLKIKGGEVRNSRVSYYCLSRPRAARAQFVRERRRER